MHPRTVACHSYCYCYCYLFPCRTSTAGLGSIDIPRRAAVMSQRVIREYPRRHIRHSVSRVCGLSANCLENEVNGVMLHGSLLKTNCWTIRAQLTSPVHGCKNYPTLISSVFPKTCVLFERGSFIHQVFLSTVPGMLFKAKFVCDNTALT